MTLTRNYLFCLFIFIFLGIIVKGCLVEDVVKEPDTFKCQWAPEANLLLKSWRGKVAVRKYTFEDMKTNLEYKVERGEYAQCVRMVGKMSPENKEKYKRNKPKHIIGNILVVIPFFMLILFPLVYDYEEKKIKRENYLKYNKEIYEKLF